MKTLVRMVLPALLPLVLTAQGPWQRITVPSSREVAAAFQVPPPEYGVVHWAIWGGELTEARIVRELDQLKANGISVIVIGPARGISPRYLSPEYFERIRFAVEELRRRGMRVWIADEGTYPSGFAGGKVSSDYPQLRMQGLAAAERIEVPARQTLSRKLSPQTLGALAVNRSDNRSLALDTSSGELQWTAPEGQWEVLLIQPQFRTSPTRYVHHPTGGKDTTNSLIDYLNPEATRAFLMTTHEEYKKYFGAEFGKTVLGFFGDEPDFSDFIPWTPRMLAEFSQRKGYDIRPYLPWFFAARMPEEAQRAKADYWDVWSDLFRDNFFKVQADWCARNNMEYLVHLNHEELMMWLVRSEGDFFKCMRYVQVPGVDNLNQTGPGIVADFPKLAGSAAHLFGRSRAWTEEGAGFGRAGSPERGKWVFDHQLVRGINLLWIRGLTTSSPEPLAAFIRYGNRASYLMSIGRPAAEIALYHPTTSMWLGDEDANRSILEITQQLMEQQRDFDFVDEQSLASLMSLEGGAFKNLSDQSYRAVVIPSSSAISRDALELLRVFAKLGGQVVFLGRTPSLVVEKTFLKAGGPPDLSWATLEPSGQVTPRVLEALPRPDVALDRPCPALKYMHRSWRDADLYFFFNESGEKQSRTALVEGRGRAQLWDAATGRIEALAGAQAVGGSLPVPLTFEPYESKFIVIGPLPAGRVR
jgi:hypothetical protein